MKLPLPKHQRNNMRILKIFLLFEILFFFSYLHSKIPLRMYINNNDFQSIKNQGAELSFAERIKQWLPYHQKEIINEFNYFTTSEYQGFRGSFCLNNNENHLDPSYLANQFLVFHGDTITLFNEEVISAHNITSNDFNDLAQQIVFLNLLFRTLGTPIPEIIYEQTDNIQTWLITNEDNIRERRIFYSFEDAIWKLNYFYQGWKIYFRFLDIRKINSRIELIGTLYSVDPSSHKTDYMDIRLHTDRNNEIDLCMIFIYRDIEMP